MKTWFRIAILTLLCGHTLASTLNLRQGRWLFVTKEVNGPSMYDLDFLSSVVASTALTDGQPAVLAVTNVNDLVSDRWTVDYINRYKAPNAIVVGQSIPYIQCAYQTTNLVAASAGVEQAKQIALAVWGSSGHAVVCSTNDYGNALIAASLAARLRAPLLFSAVSNDLNTVLGQLGVSTALVVGASMNLPVTSTNLTGSADVINWLRANGYPVNYLVAVNPADRVVTPDGSKFSLPSTLLAARRGGVVVPIQDTSSFITVSNELSQLYAAIDTDYYPEYLLMGGTPTYMPLGVVDVPGTSNIVTDATYANVDDDTFLEIAVGRLVANNFYEGSVIASRISTYDLLKDGNWENRFAEAGRWGMFEAKPVLENVGYIGDNLTAGTLNNVPPIEDSLILHYDHSGSTSLGFAFDVNQVKTLLAPAVIISKGCGTAGLDSGPQQISKDLLRQGGVGFMGGSRNLIGMSGHMVSEVTHAIAEGQSLGHACRRGFEALSLNVLDNDDHGSDYTRYNWLCLGDPALVVHVPALPASTPASMAISPDSTTLTVSAPETWWIRPFPDALLKEWGWYPRPLHAAFGAGSALLSYWAGSYDVLFPYFVAKYWTTGTVQNVAQQAGIPSPLGWTGSFASNVHVDEHTDGSRTYLWRVRLLECSQETGGTITKVITNVSYTVSNTIASVQNLAPVWRQSTIIKLNAQQAIPYTASLCGDVSDPEANPLIFQKTGGAAWLSVDLNGALRGIPDSVGVSTVTVTASDGVNPAVSATIQVTVEATPAEYFITPTTSPLTWRFAPTNGTKGSVLGDYQRNPVLNGWHIGQIIQGATTELAWSNSSGVVWNLIPDYTNLLLRTDKTCPNPGQNFSLQMSGSQVVGFYYNGQLFQRVDVRRLQVSMTANTAFHPAGVEYYFDETSGNPGATDSGWQQSSTYIDTGLSPLTQYSYRVQVRSKGVIQTTNAFTAAASATTGDSLPPVVEAGPSQSATLLTNPVGWSHTAWTTDVDSDISTQYVYTAAHCFGDNHGGSVTVNGVAFTEHFNTSGTGWSIAGTKSNWSGDDPNYLTGGSEDLTEELISGGNPRTVTFTGLTIGQKYEACFYSVGWEAGDRKQTFAATGGSSSNINQNVYGNDKGIRICYVYTATATSQVITITPDTASTFHLCAMSNRRLGNGKVVVNLDGSAVEPENAWMSTAWTKVSGPGTVVFGSTNAVDTTATFYTPGIYVLRLTADDGFGPAVTDDVTIRVYLDTGNTAPVFNSNPFIVEGVLKDVACTNTIADSATDADSDPLYYEKVSGPAWLSVATDGTLSGTPTFANLGTNTFVVSVWDDQGGQVSATMLIPVHGYPCEVEAGPNQSVTLFSTPVWSYAKWTTDADADISTQYVYTAAHCFGSNHVGSVTVNGVTFTEHCNTSGTGWSIAGNKANWLGNDNANLTGGSEDLGEEFIYGGSPRTVTFTDLIIGETYEACFYSVAWDATGERRQVFAGAGGTSSNINQNVYGENNAIRIVYVYTATSSNQVITITPTTANTFHMYAMSNRQLGSGRVTVSLDGNAFDPESAPVVSTWTTVSGPGAVVFENANAVDTTALFYAPGNYVLRLTANDGDGAVYDEVTIRVYDDTGNTPPAFNADPFSAGDASQGIPYNNTIAGSASDPDSDPLYYEKVSGPAWLIVASSGTLSGTPSYTDVGTNVFIVSTWDERGGQDSATLNIIVLDIPPVDSMPPTPNPMQFATPPAKLNSDSVTMTAVTADDISGPVEYYFENTNTLENSGWTLSTTWTNTGLIFSGDTVYAYRVKARDAVSNETVWSAAAFVGGSAPGGIDCYSVNLYAYGALPANSRNTVTLEGNQAAGVGSWSTVNWTNLLVPASGLSSPAAPVTLRSASGATAVFILNDQHSAGPYASTPPRSTLIGNANADLMDAHSNGNEKTQKGPHYFDMQVTNITFGVYDVVVYFAANQSTTDRTGVYILNSNPQVSFVLPAGEFASFIAITNSTTPGNYLAFNCLTNTTFRMQVWATGTSDLLGVAGFQLRKRDLTAPAPNPMTFSSAPAPQGAGALTMTATTATDPYGVEYFFECLTAGGHSSGWQTSPTYVDTGLAAQSNYTYRVQARDKSPSQNTNVFSSVASATTLDTAPPVITLGSPMNGAVNVALAANLVATFNETIIAGAGNITITNLTDTTVTVIDITDGTQVSISGNVLTINPLADLLRGDVYAVKIDVGAVCDLSSNPFAGITSTNTWAFTMTNPPPVVSFVPATASHPENIGVVSGTVMLSYDYNMPVTVQHRLATPGGTATPGSDFSYTTGALVFNPGETNKSFSLTVIDDTVGEGDETIIIDFGTLTNAVAGVASNFTCTIQSDTLDLPPTVTFSPVSGSGAESATPVSATVLLSKVYSGTATVDVVISASGTTATQGQDFVFGGQTLTFAPGVTNQSVSFTVIDDTQDEGAETVSLTFGTLGNADAGVASNFTYTIQADTQDVPPTVIFSPVSGSGAESATPASTMVLLSKMYSGTATVDVVVSAPGTTATQGQDFVFGGQTLTFAPGVTNQSVSFTVIDDTQDEGAETVSLTFGTLGNAVAGGQSNFTYTIQADTQDVPPTVTFSPVSGSGAESATPVSATVLLSKVYSGTATVDVVISAPGTTATQGQDFVLGGQTLTFAPGETNQNVSFTVVNDTLNEGDETVALTFASLVNAVAGVASNFTYTIQADTNDWYQTPFIETFEERTLGNLNGQRGWISSDTQVQGDVTYGGSLKAAAITNDAGFTMVTFNDSRTRIWIDVRAQVTYCPLPPTPTTNSAATFYVSDSGAVMVFNGTNAVACGQTVTEGQWARYTALCDYTTATWTFYVNGIRTGSYLFFNPALASFNAFQTSGTAIIDDVSVAVERPSGLASNATIILLK